MTKQQSEERRRRAEETGRLMREQRAEADRRAAPVLAEAARVWNEVESRLEQEQERRAKQRRRARRRPPA